MAAEITQTVELSIQLKGTKPSGDDDYFTFKLPNPKSTATKDAVVSAIGDILKTKVFASNLSSDTSSYTTILATSYSTLEDVGTVKRIEKKETVWKD